MQNNLRLLSLLTCVLVLAACSTGPKQVPPVPEPTPTPAEPVYIPPASVNANHDWPQRRHLLVLMHEAQLELANMLAVGDETAPIVLLESQSHQLFMGGGQDIADYQTKLDAYVSANQAQTAVWTEAELLAQFSIMLDWSTAEFSQQMHLDYPHLQRLLVDYLHVAMDPFPYDYELAVSLIHDQQKAYSLLLVEGAALAPHIGEFQARLLTALHDLEAGFTAVLPGYGKALLGPTMTLRKAPLVRFVLLPIVSE